MAKCRASACTVGVTHEETSRQALREVRRGRMKKYSYLIVMETDTPKDLEDVIQNEFVRIAGHRNKIILYRCESGFRMLSEKVD